MIANIKYNNRNYQINLQEPLDISIPLRASKENVNAWYLDAPRIEPFVSENWVAKVSEGASVNFNNIYFNPHGHGTHTECVGHITEDFHSINTSLQQFFYLAELVTIPPEKVGEDWIISEKQLAYALGSKKREAIIIRTLPNLKDKRNKQYSHSNPPYLTEGAAAFLRQKGIEHLLIDLPSVDKESDEGKLLAHKAFWNFNDEIRYEATITELIFVCNTIEDGTYFLNIQIAPFENDATPSKPILYKIQNY